MDGRRTERNDMYVEQSEQHEAAAPPSRWLTGREAADYANLSADTIYTACERGELRHARVSGRRTIRLRREWIDAWLERHTRG